MGTQYTSDVASDKQALEITKQNNDNKAYFSGWWFPPNWKILVKMGIFPR